jgi:hypothetical protein
VLGARPLAATAEVTSVVETGTRNPQIAIHPALRIYFDTSALDPETHTEASTAHIQPKRLTKVEGLSKIPPGHSYNDPIEP